MSTVEDFKNAPFGATANCADGGRAMKMSGGGRCWILPNWFSYSDEEMPRWGYTLDLPTTAREALDLAWDRAHPVKEWQVIPKGTRYLEKRNHGLIKECTADRLIALSDGLRNSVRTLEPLPDPEPDWLDALVVLARHVKQAPDSPPSLWVNLGNGLWGLVEGTKRAEVWDLRDVTPLYPEGKKE